MLTAEELHQEYLQAYQIWHFDFELPSALGRDTSGLGLHGTVSGATAAYRAMEDGCAVGGGCLALNGGAAKFAFAPLTNAQFDRNVDRHLSVRRRSGGACWSGS